MPYVRGTVSLAGGGVFAGGEGLRLLVVFQSHRDRQRLAGIGPELADDIRTIRLRSWRARVENDLPEHRARRAIEPIEEMDSVPPFHHPTGAAPESCRLQCDVEHRVKINARWCPAIGHGAEGDDHSLAIETPLADDRSILRDLDAFDAGTTRCIRGARLPDHERDRQPDEDAEGRDDGHAREAS